MEDDKRVKKRSILLLISLLFCTFLQLLVELPQIHQTQVSQMEPNLKGIWSSIIKVEKISSSPTVSVSSGMSATQISERLEVSYKLFGIFPLRSAEVEVMNPMKLIPGGQSIGVTLQTKGVMVVGQAPVVDKNGKDSFPAKEAGIQVGDILLKIENQEVKTDQEVSNAINLAGKQKGSANVLFKHEDQIVEKTVHPIFCVETGRYRIGLFVRDEAAGVGTLSFLDPVSKLYGALGHVITDADTNQKIEVYNGKIIGSTIYAIEKGKRGHPGEKIGSFIPNSAFSGTIERNTMTGIFGRMSGQIENPYFKEAIPVGWESDIKVGPAKIYTVIQGEKIEEFDVNIDRVMHNRTDSKNMIVRVTDPRLLEVTGGIIQGMSGSPIVQNGKLIGAVTHVFVNDSQRGYGVFIQNMLNDSNQLTKKEAA
ncbi:SpoIVB peptidase [Desulfosporosinus sp.]|uniref:SpoIVB peptidase n=1 Tax=Desulfosporosinus sp. TaxID=157907 RepID=UPI0025C45627|nr:SpoIVB peptidase [Desulfosporosinus sp.]MBC2722380.1 SpoIVB peptidase [Desulfosporosinus sp.]MBC2726846.1 SpoIVB peptidase [Desulfosporosinus sp.]